MLPTALSLFLYSGPRLIAIPFNLLIPLNFSVLRCGLFGIVEMKQVWSFFLSYAGDSDFMQTDLKYTGFALHVGTNVNKK